MSYFLLYGAPILNPSNITYKMNTDASDVIISKTLYKYLNSMKRQIDEVHIKWDNVKKYTNPYEYIHTPVPGTKNGICKYIPLSRSYFKMIEMCNQMDILEDYNNGPITTFSLCEGPGGFIEALSYLRNNINDKYYGMTLLSTDNNVPGWKKSDAFLQEHTNIIIEKGASNTGDIFDVDNFKYCYDKYKNSINIITGDGGFDFSVDFNKQEQISGKLILMQVIYALVMQKYQGHFILNVFDIFTHITIDILFLLSSLYEKVWIIKPNTSRYANSERYIICKNFKIADSSIYYNKCLELFVEYDTNRDMFLHNILNIKPSYLFINRLEDCNAILGQQQLETLSNTINMIDNKNKEKMETIKKNNIQKCINWCIKNRMPYIRSISSTNTFIDNE